MDFINPRCKQQMTWDKKTLTWHCHKCHAETKTFKQSLKDSSTKQQTLNKTTHT